MYEPNSSTGMGEIILDRKHMNLKVYRIALGKPFGINTLKAVVGNLPTITHELAHMIYHTDDNTVLHYQMMEKIYHEITALYRDL
jgi:Zn-dependent peptidase ImmA (M78 family)